MIETKKIETARRPGEPEWLGRMRQEAYARFTALGFPTTRDEDWKYTNLNPVARTTFEPAAPAKTDVLSPFLDLGCALRLVFVNGHFSKELSSDGNSLKGVVAGSLAGLLKAGNPMLESHLARYASVDGRALVALNTAMFEDGAAVIIERGAVPETPIQLVYVSEPGGRPTVSHPRNLIIAGKGSQASVLEIYLGPGGATYFTNAATEIATAEGAILDHYKVQAEGAQSFHVATVQAVQDRASLLNSHNISMGAALARNDINSILDEQGADCCLNGLFSAGGRQHVDNHTMLDHAKPHCTSRELYKGILSGQATGVFNGKIVVRKDAQKTNAFQSNKNLLLSGEAVINTKPQLEIFADDVRCTHGATVGQLDHEALFYMRTRGILVSEARSLLTHAFAGEVLERIGWPPLRERLEIELARVLAEPAGGGWQ